MTSEDESHEDDSGEIRPKYKDSGFLRYFFPFFKFVYHSYLENSFTFLPIHLMSFSLRLLFTIMKI